MTDGSKNKNKSIGTDNPMVWTCNEQTNICKPKGYN